MVWTIKKTLGRLMVTNPLELLEETQKSLYVYILRPSIGIVSTFDIMSGAQTRFLPSDTEVSPCSSSPESRRVDLLITMTKRARRV